MKIRMTCSILMKGLLFLSLTFLTSYFGFAQKKQFKEKSGKEEFCITTQMQKDLQEIYDEVKLNTSGKVADYIPELAKVPGNLYSIVIMTVNGELFSIGDSDYQFSIQSISKPFVFGRVMDDLGIETTISKIGLFPTGFAFNSLTAIEVRPTRLQNPMVNAGAIVTTSLVYGSSSDEKWNRIMHLFEDYTSRDIMINQDVYTSEMANNNNNMAIAYRMSALGLLSGDVYDAVDRYTRACALSVNTVDLASIGATMANGGVHPKTKKVIASKESVKNILSAMIMSGMYDNSGDWLSRIGLPAKSGVGGGLIAIVPNKFAIAVFSPLLDEFGNSVKGIETVSKLSKKWKLHIFDTI